jgi:outer membrane protein assembly factor BamE (lipoprotein component of BamABCDE complex)
MKNVRVILAGAVFALLVIAACASAGKQFDRTHVNDVQNKVQDKNQIRAWFGEPYRVQTLTGSTIGCMERWTYVHAFSSFGGAKTTSASLIVDFDKSGKVCDHAYVEQ